MAGNNITDANEIKGQTSANLKVESQGSSNKLQLFSGEDVQINVGDVTADNVNISGKTNITGDSSQPHTLKVITDMNDSDSEELHNSMTLLLEGYDSTGNGILNEVQNSITFQVADETTTHTVGRYSAEFDTNGVDNKMKLISVNNGSAGNDGNASGNIGAVSPGGNGQIDLTCQVFRSNVPVLFPHYTTTERGTLHIVQNGMVIYNSTTNKFQGYANGAWVDLH
jgi:hypothetical protein